MTTEAAPGAGGPGTAPEGLSLHGSDRHGLFSPTSAAGPTVGMVVHRVLARSPGPSSSTTSTRRCWSATGGAGWPGHVVGCRTAAVGPERHRAGRQGGAAGFGDRADPPEPGGPAPDPVQPAHVPPGPRPGLGDRAAGRAGLVQRAPRPAAGPAHHRGDDPRQGPEVLSPSNVDRLDAVLADRGCRGRGGTGRRAGERPPVPADRADDGAVGRARTSTPRPACRPTRRCPPWSSGPGTTSGVRPGTARKQPNEVNLHALRIRLKDLRYGCETVALVEGGPASKTAKAAERLQTKLGDVHDARFSIDWLGRWRRSGPSCPSPSRPWSRGRRPGRSGPQGVEAGPQGGRAPLAELAGLIRAPTGRGYAVGRFTPTWSTSQSLMPPRIPAVLSTMVTSSSSPSRLTRRELPPPM